MINDCRWIFLSLIVILFTVVCAGSQKSNSLIEDNNHFSKWVYEGWGCEPERKSSPQRPNQRCRFAANQDYLYLPFIRRNSSRISRGNDLVRKKSTCYRNARNYIASSRFTKILARFINFQYDYQSSHSLAISFLADQSSPLGEIRLYHCCSLETDAILCENPAVASPTSWNSCLCVAALQFIGGETILENEIKKRTVKKN